MSLDPGDTRCNLEGIYVAGMWMKKRRRTSVINYIVWYDDVVSFLVITRNNTIGCLMMEMGTRMDEMS